MIGKENLLYKTNSFDYTFFKGHGGRSFSLIVLGEVKDDPQIYDSGVALLEDTIRNLDALGEIDLMLFANSILVLEKNDFVELRKSFFEKLDRYVDKRINDLEVSFDSLHVFLFLYYCVHRYEHLKSEYLIYQVVVNLLCEIIIKIDNIPETKRTEIFQHNIKFFYYCELLVSIFMDLDFCKKLAVRLREAIHKVYKEETGTSCFGHGCFETLYFHAISKTKNPEAPLSTIIQSNFSNSTSAPLTNDREVFLNDDLKQGILNSSLGLALSEIAKKSPYSIDINFLVQFYSHKNHDISFGPTGRVLL